MPTAGSYFDEIWRMERRLKQKRRIIMEYRRLAVKNPCSMEMSILCAIDLEREVGREQSALDRRKATARAMIALLPTEAMRRAMTRRYLSGYAGASLRAPLGALRAVSRLLPGERDHELVAQGAREE